MAFLEGGEVAGAEVFFGDPAGSGPAPGAHPGGAPESVCGWGEAELQEGVARVDVNGDPLTRAALAPFEEAEGGHGRGLGAADLEQARDGGAAVEVAGRFRDWAEAVGATPDIGEVESVEAAGFLVHPSDGVVRGDCLVASFP